MDRRGRQRSRVGRRRSRDAARHRKAPGDRVEAAEVERGGGARRRSEPVDRKSTRLNSSHITMSYAVFCMKKITSLNPMASEEVISLIRPTRGIFVNTG